MTGTIQNLSGVPQHTLGGMAARVQSILDLPVLGGKGSPKKFQGDHTRIATFLDHHDQLCTQYNLIADSDKCKAMLRYCSRKVRETIEGLNSYQNPDYRRLREDLLELYDDELLKKRFKKRDLEQFLRSSRKRKIRTLGDFRRFEREFIRIGGWLRNEAKISDNDYNNGFWKGLPSKLCRRLEFRLVAQNPNHDMRRPFSVEDVVRAAEKALQRDRFDADKSDAGDRSSEEEDDEKSEDDGSDESEDEGDDEGVRRRRKLAKRLQKESTRPKNRNDDEDDDWHVPEPKGSQEMESLIRKMERLSVNTAEYAVLWYRAVKMDPKIEEILTRPRLAGLTQGPPIMHQPPPFENRQPPPHFYPPATRPPRMNRPSGSEMECFGCGDKGHGIGQCEKVNRMITSGTLSKDQNGRLVWKDGSRIFRTPGEPFVVAVERQSGKSNLVTVAAVEYYQTDEEESDLDAFEVYRPDRVTKNTRRQVMKEVLIPKKKVVRSNKENIPARTEERPRSVPEREQHPANKGARAPVMVPIEVRKPAFDVENDEELMKDVDEELERVPIQEKTIPRKEKVRMDQENEKRKYTPRQSELTAHVNPTAVMNKILNTPMTISIGELIGASKEVSNSMQNVLKVRRFEGRDGATATAGKTPVTSLFTSTKGRLIRLNMECEGKPVEAVIDSGSMLNIMSRKVWKTSIVKPIDITKTMQMNDANGGVGQLAGVAKRVPLHCGNVKTFADIYVGDHVPFDLLLGRPWQRDNRVGIDERSDGTYLTFKSERHPEIQYEILALPDEQLRYGGMTMDPLSRVTTRPTEEALSTYTATVRSGESYGDVEEPPMEPNRDDEAMVEDERDDERDSWSTVPSQGTREDQEIEEEEESRWPKIEAGDWDLSDAERRVCETYVNEGLDEELEEASQEEFRIRSSGSVEPLILTQNWTEDFRNVSTTPEEELNWINQLLFRLPQGHPRVKNVRVFRRLLHRYRLLAGIPPERRNCDVMAAQEIVIMAFNDDRYSGEQNNLPYWEYAEVLSRDTYLPKMARTWFYLISSAEREYCGLARKTPPEFMAEKLLSYMDRRNDQPDVRYFPEAEALNEELEDFQEEPDLSYVMQQVILRRRRGTLTDDEGSFVDPGFLGEGQVWSLNEFLDFWGLSEFNEKPAFPGPDSPALDFAQGIVARSEVVPYLKMDPPSDPEASEKQKKAYLALMPLCLDKFEQLAYMTENEWREIDEKIDFEESERQKASLTRLRRNGHRYRLLAGLAPLCRDGHLMAAQEIIILARYQRDDNGRYLNFPDYQVADRLADETSLPESARVWFHVIRNAERAMARLPVIDAPPFFLQTMREYYNSNLRDTDYEKEPITSRDFASDEEMYLAMSDAIRTRKDSRIKNETRMEKGSEDDSNNNDVVKDLTTYLEMWGLGEKFEADPGNEALKAEKGARSINIYTRPRDEENRPLDPYETQPPLVLYMSITGATSPADNDPTVPPPLPSPPTLPITCPNVDGVFKTRSTPLPTRSGMASLAKSNAIRVLKVTLLFVLTVLL